MLRGSTLWIRGSWALDIYNPYNHSKLKPIVFSGIVPIHKIIPHSGYYFRGPVPVDKVYEVTYKIIDRDKFVGEEDGHSCRYVGGKCHLFIQRGFADISDRILS